MDFTTSFVTNSVALHPLIVDVDRNGRNDIVVVDDYVDTKGNDATNVKTVCWFSAAGESQEYGFRRHIIMEINYRSCGITATDINGDGYTDIVGRYDTDGDDRNDTGAIFWLSNPFGKEGSNEYGWEKTDIGFSTYAKDILAADFNLDNKIDVVSRGVDGMLRVYIQQSPTQWRIVEIEAPHHDGTEVGDMDNDGDPDIVINGMWYETPSNVINGEWIRHDYAPEWYRQKTGPEGRWFDNNTKVALEDMDRDGWLDIIISNAENTGYAICWYKNPAGGSEDAWMEHPVGYMNYAHTLCIADMDRDGDLDIVSGELIFGSAPNPEGPHPVAVFLNRGNNMEWNKQVISETGCYGGIVGDMDDDGDLDIVAPRNYNKAPLYFWRNRLEEQLDIKDINIEETVEQGISCYKITTPSATYLYDRAGGGFMSMIDQDGNDWISFKTDDYPFPGNAASRYRGIPNLGIGGEDNDAGHPGFDRCQTVIIAPNVIETTTKSGNWKFRWAFYNSYAKFTMVKSLPDIPYWFLYEGTPAGRYDPGSMYWGNNLDGMRDNFPDLLQNTGIYNNFNWVYVGQKNYDRILFLKQSQTDLKPDLFSYMGNTTGGSDKSPDGMVCFGFGRAHRTQPVLTGDNKEFLIGFMEFEVSGKTDHDMVSIMIDGVQ
jgi:hypothetical protein